MSKYNITFNGKSYAIDKSSLADAIASLETALSGLESGGANLITFTINVNGVYYNEYQMEEGMTWGEWIDSPYNTGVEWDNGEISKFYYNDAFCIDGKGSNDGITYIMTASHEDGLYDMDPPTLTDPIYHERCTYDFY